MQSNNKIQISNLEIIFIDDDGFARGHILNKNTSDQEISIPFDKTNIDFNIGDHLLVELEFVGKKQYKFKKIIKKIEFEKNYFFAEVKLTSKGKFYLNELERGSQKKAKIQPILNQVVENWRNLAEGPAIRVCRQVNSVSHEFYTSLHCINVCRKSIPSSVWYFGVRVTVGSVRDKSSRGRNDGGFC